MVDPISAGINLGGKVLDTTFGWLAGNEQARQQRAAAKQLQQGIDQARGIYKSGAEDVSQMYDPYVTQGLDAWGQMPGMARDLRATNFRLPEMGEFEYQREVSDFLDPSMAYQQEQARRQLEASAAASGGLMSGATLKGIQERGQDLARQDWGNAYSRMVGDKNFAYQDYLNRFNTQKANVQDRYSKMVDDYNRNMGISDIGRSAVGSQAQIGAKLTGQLGDLSIQEANVRAQRAQIPGFWGQLAGQSGNIGGIVSQGYQFGKDLYNAPTSTSVPTGTPYQGNMNVAPQYNPQFGNYGMQSSYGQQGYMNNPYGGF